VKILQVHNYYQLSGGEDFVLKNEKKLLEDNGHQVTQYIRNNHEIDNFSLKQKINFLLSVHYSKFSKLHFENFLLSSKPDLIHVHNFFPLITPSIFSVCQEYGIPVLMTLHNYRLIYPNGYLFCKGEVDERTLKKSAYVTVMDGVYRNSIFQTLVVAHMIEYHRKKNTWNEQVNKFICLSNFSKRIFVKGGILSKKIIVKPNFIEDKIQLIPNVSPVKTPYFVFVGRISNEKGIRMLIETWMRYKLNYPLYVIGTGPLRKSLEEKTKNIESVKWLGLQSKGVVLNFVKHAKALVFPSTWYEGFPMTILEAFSLGTAVVTSNIGSQAEIVKNNYSGLHFRVNKIVDLKEKLDLIYNNEALAEEFGRNARDVYLQNYLPKDNYRLLLSIYQNILANKDKPNK